MNTIKIELDEYIEKPLNNLSPYYLYKILLGNIQVGTLIYRTGSIQDHYYDGHIGYTIEENYRGHHYSYLAVKELLKDIDHDVIITCEEGNIASQKIIERCNAQYLDTKPIPTHLKKQFSKNEKVKRIYIIKKENFYDKSI